MRTTLMLMLVCLLAIGLVGAITVTMGTTGTAQAASAEAIPVGMDAMLIDEEPNEITLVTGILVGQDGTMAAADKADIAVHLSGLIE